MLFESCRHPSCLVSHLYPAPSFSPFLRQVFSSVWTSFSQPPTVYDAEYLSYVYNHTAAHGVRAVLLLLCDTAASLRCGLLVPLHKNK